MENRLLESNYTHRLTLFAVLTKLSPQIGPFIDKTFGQFLRSNILASNSSNLPTKLDERFGVPTLEAQKQLIGKFSKYEEKGNRPRYLALFNNLIGISIKGFIDKSCSIFFQQHPTAPLIRIAGAEFVYRPAENKSNTKNSFPSADAVDPAFQAIINLVKKDNRAVKDTLEADKFVHEEWREDEMNCEKYANDKRQVIDRRDMLYSRISFGRITSSKFCLENKDSSTAFKEVLKQYFCIDIDCKKMSVLHVSTLQMHFDTMRANYRRCRLDNLLRKYCPVPIIDSRKPEVFDMKDALAQHTPRENLFNFIYAVYYTVFPSKMFGSKRNQRLLFANLKSAFTGSLTVSMRIFDLAHGICLSDMQPLFADLPDYVPDGKLETLFIYWIFDCLKQLVKAKFYITEGANQKFSLLYYRYDLWARLKHHAANQLVQKKQWQLLQPVELPGKCSHISDYIKYSVLRLIPKKSSLRPITSLKFYHKELEYKRLLRVCLLLLKKVGRDAAFDSENGSAHKIHERIAKLKEDGGSDSGSGGPYYVVRGDFEDCYQSIDLAKLLGLVQERLLRMEGQANDYTLPIERVKVVRKIGGGFYVKRTDFLVKPSDCKRDSLFRGNDLAKLAETAAKQLTTQFTNNCILSSTGSKCVVLTKALALLKIYLNESVVQLGRKTHYEMMRGIRQGSTLSSELCSIYISCLWREVFDEQLQMTTAADSSQFFLYIADDFLFVSKDRKNAQAFAAKVRDGFPDWGLKVNCNKFITNFDIDTGELNNGGEISFFGRKIKPEDLSLGLDLESFASQRVVDTFNCNCFLPVIRLLSFTVATLGYNFWPEMVDLKIVPFKQVVQNLFERFLLQAFRLAGFLCSSPTWRQYHDKLGAHICLLIYNLSNRMSKMIHKWKVQKATMQFTLSRRHLQYITASAFRLLWEKGPHKVKCRVGEKTAILICCKQLRQLGAHQLANNVQICVPTEMNPPFNSFKM